MAWILLVLTTLGTAVDVELSLSDGSRHSGRLRQLSAAGVVIEVQGAEREYPLEQLQQLRFPTTVASNEAAAHLATLTDGTQLKLNDLSAREGEFTLQWLAHDAPLTLPRRALQSVRLMDLSSDLLATWDQIGLKPGKADIVVIRQNNRLQPIEGVMGDIDGAKVRFQFEGDWIDVRREKIAGLLLVAPTGSNQGLPRGTLITRDGSRVPMRDFALSDGRLSLETPNGTPLSVPLDQLTQIDLSTLSIDYLSDLEAERTDFQPFVEVRGLAEIELQWFQPQRDLRLTREPLVTHTSEGLRSFAKGISLHSQSRLDYRLASKYRRFQALAEVDDAAGPGRLTLVMVADGTERLRQEVATGEPAREIDVDLNGVNRLQLLVDYGDRSDLGDHLNLYDARFLK